MPRPHAQSFSNLCFNYSSVLGRGEILSLGISYEYNSTCITFATWRHEQARPSEGATGADGAGDGANGSEKKPKKVKKRRKSEEAGAGGGIGVKGQTKTAKKKKKTKDV